MDAKSKSGMEGADPGEDGEDGEDGQDRDDREDADDGENGQGEMAVFNLQIESLNTRECRQSLYPELQHSEIRSLHRPV